MSNGLHHDHGCDKRDVRRSGSDTVAQNLPTNRFSDFSSSTINCPSPTHDSAACMFFCLTMRWLPGLGVRQPPGVHGLSDFKFRSMAQNGLRPSFLSLHHPTFKFHHSTTFHTPDTPTDVNLSSTSTISKSQVKFLMSK